MKSVTLDFPHNSRTTYTAVKHIFEMKRTKFSSIKCNDDLFIVEARHGWIPGYGNAINATTAASVVEGIGWGAVKYFDS